jgi:hypothetical protein
MAGPAQPVNWMMAFKFNAASFPGCGVGCSPPSVGAPGIFGGKEVQYSNGCSQQYVYATNLNPALAKGSGCLGATLTDPLGATFAQVYNTPGYFYVIWNDQLAEIPGGTGTAFAPWGHSKGLLAWNQDGAGFVLQVSTPGWPGSGSSANPRQADGNTLGCISHDDIEFSQHFFALALSSADVGAVLTALGNASVWTSPNLRSLLNNGGPPAIQALAASLGNCSASSSCTMATLSSGVRLISKPSRLPVPPWQLVSAKLNSVPLRVACWWTVPDPMNSTTAGGVPGCWAPGLTAPGAVQIATTGNWQGSSLNLKGGGDDDGNHAKIGVSTDPAQTLCIFGDMNQQGTLNPRPGFPNATACDASQNARGGTFYVLDNGPLFKSLTSLLKGDSAPV